jgi:hypothetical protein
MPGYGRITALHLKWINYKQSDVKRFAGTKSLNSSRSKLQPIIFYTAGSDDVRVGEFTPFE